MQAISYKYNDIIFKYYITEKKLRKIQIKVDFIVKITILLYL